ncbi:MAG: tetratricopeptide repeat protein [Magnetospirillum sp. WYHS-4]
MGLGQALDHYRRNRPDMAEALCRAIPSSHPDHAAALYLLGVMARERGDAPAALASLQDAATRAPGNPSFRSTLGVMQEEGGLVEEAAESYRTAIALGHPGAAPRLSLGKLLRRLGRPEEAASVLEDALVRDAHLAEAHRELGDVRRTLGDAEGALAAYDAAIALAPDDAAAHGHRALVRLLLGDLDGGFSEYEWRWKDPAFRSSALPADAPLWDGGPLEGLTLRLVAEQGFGDSFQFLRYAPLAAARGARVQVLCQKKLVDLAATVPGVALAQAQDALPAPADCQASLLSLPRLFGTRLETVPSPIPYIRPPAERVADWRRRLAGHQGFKIALVWRGASSAGRLAARGEALRPEHLAPLVHRPGISAFSLQKDPEPAELEALGGLPHLADAVATFGDTAAALMAFDLLVSIDTATVHLAGALGIPCRVLLVPVHDWRWLRNREDSPWYPSLRLHRRAAGESWEAAIGRLAADLDRLRAQP